MSYIESAAPVKSQAAASGLKASRLTFCEAAMMIVGSTIGSGVLGLAYASRKQAGRCLSSGLPWRL